MTRLDALRPLDCYYRLAPELEALEALVAPAAGRHLVDLDSMDREGEEKRWREFVRLRGPELLQDWDRLERPLFLTDRSAREMARDDVESVVEEEEEETLGLAPQGRLYWSMEVASCASFRWAHRSSMCAAAAADEAAAAAADEAAAAAAAAASHCEFGEKLVRVDGS